MSPAQLVGMWLMVVAILLATLSIVLLQPSTHTIDIPTTTTGTGVMPRQSAPNIPDCPLIARYWLEAPAHEPGFHGVHDPTLGFSAQNTGTHKIWIGICE